MNKPILLAGALVFCLGCGVSKKHASKAPKADSTASVVVYDTAMKRPDPVLPAPAGTVLTPDAAQRFLSRPAFQTFSGKAKAAYEANGDRKEFSMVIRIQSGKAIWVSINALGGLVNVARALITPDSIQAINYLQREAYRMPYSAASRFLPVSVPFETLQALLTGDPLFAADAPGLSMSETGETVTLLQQRANTTQTLGFRKSDNSLQTASFNAATSVNRISLQLGYDDYSARSSRPFPKDRTAQINSQGKASSLELHFDEPTWDETVELPFSIPSKYTLK